MPLLPFFHQISFSKVDPLGDGLREEIEAERMEPEAIRVLEDGVVDGELSSYWQSVENELQNDPDKLHFSD